MFDTVILLTGPIERNALPAALLGHNPALTVLTIERAEELAAIESDVLRRARLIAFVTPVIVPKRILDQIGYGAVNFHPGPPSYPAGRRRTSHFMTRPRTSARPSMSWSSASMRGRSWISRCFRSRKTRPCSG